MKKIPILLSLITCYLLLSCNKNASLDSNDGSSIEESFVFVEKDDYIKNPQEIANRINKSLEENYLCNPSVNPNPCDQVDFLTTNEHISLTDSATLSESLTFDYDYVQKTLGLDITEESYPDYVTDSIKRKGAFYFPASCFPFEDGYYYHYWKFFKEKYFALYYSDNDVVYPAMFQIHSDDVKKIQNTTYISARVEMISYGDSVAYILNNTCFGNTFLYLLTKQTDLSFDIYYYSKYNQSYDIENTIFVPKNDKFSKKCLAYLSKMQRVHYYDREQVAMYLI